MEADIYRVRAFDKNTGDLSQFCGLLTASAIRVEAPAHFHTEINVSV